MSNEKNKENHDNKDLNLLFDNFLKPGVVLKEKEVVKGFKVKLKPLTTGELLSAEAIMDNSTAPADIVAKVRGASILSQAIVSLNDVEIERDDFTPQESRGRRLELYRQLLKMPPMVIHKAYSFYIECVEEQNSKYQDIPGLADQIENF